jgi:uncharacterized RDD family membrane protein YckC
MNIKNLLSKLTKTHDIKYVGSFRRSTASLIDIWIVIFLRATTMHLFGKFWLEEKFIKLKQDFVTNFGTDTPKNTPEHINFIINSDAFLCLVISIMIVILVGALYHAYFNASAWNATIGKRIMKIMVLKESGLKISFLRAISHYFLSILPFIFIAYLLSFKAHNQVSFYSAITASELNVFLTLLFIIWMQIHLFTKKKTTIYDMICNTVLVRGRTATRFPWGKIVENNLEKKS